nr:biotin/lipoyl-containing protein [uncultured Oscillibacter sp.]
MSIEVLMPKLGLTMTEGTIEEWKFQEGDAVRKGDVLFTVATDKLTNDVECEADGTLLKIVLPAGETADCKSVVAYIGEAGEQAPAGSAAPGKAAPAKAAPAAQDAPPGASPASAPTPAEEQSQRLRVSPYARRTARELGVDLSKVTGTGPNGRIVWRDVDAAAQAKAAAPAGTAVAGFYTTADIRELLAALDSLNGALTLNAFVEKAAAKLETSVALRFAGEGIEGMLPGLEAGETAVLAAGAPMDGKVRLHLAYVPAALDDEEAAKLLRTMRTLLEYPLMLLV